MSRVWKFIAPRGDFTYAEAGRRGSWTTVKSDLCPECTAGGQERAQPLIMAWEPGSEVIGDFVWPAINMTVVATERVVSALESRFAGFERGPIKMVDDPGRARRRLPRVKLPYEGPALTELWITVCVNADRERSTIELKRRCATCGNEYWRVAGVEHFERTYDPTKGNVYTRVARAPGAGIYVSGKDLAGADIFRVSEVPGMVLGTDAVRDLVRERGFTNVDFLEVGELT